MLQPRQVYHAHQQAQDPLVSQALPLVLQVLKLRLLLLGQVDQVVRDYQRGLRFHWVHGLQALPSLPEHRLVQTLPADREYLILLEVLGGHFLPLHPLGQLIQVHR